MPLQTFLHYPFRGQAGGTARFAAAQRRVVSGDTFGVCGLVKGQYAVYKAALVFGKHAGPGMDIAVKVADAYIVGYIGAVKESFEPRQGTI